MMDIKLKIRTGKYIETIPAHLVISDNKTRITFPYNVQALEEIKQFQGRRFIDRSSGGPAWEFENCERNTYALKYLMGWRPTECIHKIKWDHIDSNLYQHQVQIINFILTNRRCMIAAEMGLGKTLAMIRAMELSPANYWWLVAPYGAQREWARQLDRWDAKCPPKIITTYESLHKYMDAAEHPPEGVIFDESYRIKNPSAQRSQAAGHLCRLMRENDPESYIVHLSGAPAPKDPSDWWHQIECLEPGFIREGNIHKFRQRYANIVFETGEFGKYPVIKSWKEDQLSKLGKRLSPIVLSLKKKDCLDLPDKIFDPITCTQGEEYSRVVDLMMKSAASPIEALTWLRELSDGFKYRSKMVHQEFPGEETPIYEWIGSPKIAILEELLDFYHEENGGPGRLVVYASFIATIEYLEKFIKTKKWDVATISGKGWSDEKLLERFDSDTGNICLVANPACVHGISLQRTECLVYYSNSFSVDHRIQSLDRRDRPGMDTSKGTRIVDIINLPVDQLILDRLNSGIELQAITMKEIRQVMG